MRMQRYLIRVNMRELKCTYSEKPIAYQKLGGRGLTVAIMNDEVSPAANPLGPRNKLIFSPGVFAGTNCPCVQRISVGSKSPLTEGIKDWYFL